MDEIQNLAGGDAVKYARLAAALIRSDYLIEHIEAAKAVFRSNEFYDYGRFLWARNVIEEALGLYSSTYGFTNIGLSHLRMKYGTANPSEIWKATEDTEENPFIETLMPWVEEEISFFKPDIIGISFALDEQLIPGFTLARQLRDKWDGVLVAGGSMVTRLRNELPSDPRLSRVFDHYFTYESEAEFGAFVDRSGGDQVAVASDFSNLCPDFDDLPLNSYLLPELILPFAMTRGCSYGRCLYCGHYKTYGRFKRGNAIAATENLKRLSERYSCKKFYFVDESIEPEFGVAFSEALKNSGVDISWMVFARPHDHWNKRAVEKIADAGCRKLIFGLDAATERVQKLMNKNIDLQYAEHIFECCAANGIALQLNFIVGFPGEEELEAREAISFVKRNLNSLLTVGSTIAFTNFVLVRESAWDNMKIDPVINPEKPLGIYYAYRTPSGLTMQQTSGLAKSLQKEADKNLRASWRYPLLREFSFLYRDRYGKDGIAPRSTEAPVPGTKVYCFNHNIQKLFHKIVDAEEKLPVVPQEYVSTWWRLASETDLSSVKDGSLYGYRLGANLKENSCELTVNEMFMWPV